MKMLAVSKSPRKSKNTASILKNICKGAVAQGMETTGMETELAHLHSLPYTGCARCFQIAAKDRRHVEIFPLELQRVFDFGASLVKI